MSSATGGAEPAQGSLPVPQAERSKSYLRLLLILLLPAALFNSYDSELRALLLTQIKASFHVGTAAIGLANIPIGAGQFIAFFLVLRADRIGRRPILMWSILGYTIFTTLTAASWNLWSFAAFQFGAQVFIGAEFGVAVTLLAEEVPAVRRGHYLALLLLFSPAGAVVGGILVAAGFLHNPIGWHAFFLVAAIPLVVVAAGRRHLQESRAFVAAKSRGELPPKRSLRRSISDGVAIWRQDERWKALAVGVVALLQGLPAAGAIGWFTYYAERERHLSTGTAGTFFAIAALFSITGYVVCGRLMDRIGRKPTAIIYVVAAVVCALGTFQIRNEWIMLPFLSGTAFFGVGIAPVLSAFATELFPTSVRAQAGAWIRNGFGNTGSVLGPAIIGVMGASGGLVGNIGDSVSLIALISLPIAFIVWRFIPETRQVALDVAGDPVPDARLPGDPAQSDRGPLPHRSG